MFIREYCVYNLHLDGKHRQRMGLCNSTPLPNEQMMSSICSSLLSFFYMYLMAEQFFFWASRLIDGWWKRNVASIIFVGKGVPGRYKTEKLQILLSVLGDPRTNQNPALLTFGILFFRWHNVVASRVQHEHPDWSDEDVFQRARRVVIATLQVITQKKPKVVGVVTDRFVVSEHYLLRVPSGISRRRVTGIRRI